MTVSHRFSFPLSGGMHARPASALEHAARRFDAEVSLTNDRTGRAANAKSVLGIVGLGVGFKGVFNQLAGVETAPPSLEMELDAEAMHFSGLETIVF